MAPNQVDVSTTLVTENSQEDINKNLTPNSKSLQPIVWRNVIIFIYLHLSALYGLYLVFTEAKILTIIWCNIVRLAAGVGITAGAHRLWTHRAYKAKWPLRVILMLLNSAAFQNDIYDWTRDHRVHHKFTDTDADPHNAKRGFFYSHMGWLLVRKHPEVKKKGATIDMSDVEQDPIVAWQRRYYSILMPVCAFIIPIWVPCYFWNEKLFVAYHIAVLRYVSVLHSTWLVNSAAHMWGMKPYDKNIGPTDHVVTSIIAIGEGWHNYHHVFPWDYKTGELHGYASNLTTGVIDFCARLGLAYDLKTASPEAIKKRAMKTGDGSIYAPSVTDG
ncbi:unnamed protein product [Xylocopa violacea]|uniref:Fatty acid desaturase domain-containing protein n=1 Tax=Xylocopa violacea TaxID=135666 RepID=A0ABP1MZH0_XYLVO